MNLSDLSKLSRQRGILIQDLENKLEKRLQSDQKKLSKEIAKEFTEKLQLDENGRVKNNAYNRNLLHKIEGVFKSFSKIANPRLISMIIANVSSIYLFNEKYFQELATKKLGTISNRVKQSMNTWLGISGNKATENGYLNTIISDREAKIRVHKTALSIMQGQKGYQDSVKQMKKVIEGDKERLGVFERYYRQFLYDLNSQIDRSVSNEFATNLDLEFAVYEGGLIKTSREFCIEHSGNIYHRSEILEFNPKKAIPDNYNPIQDLGGYNCRHYLNWISVSMAKALGKAVEDFLE